MASDEEVRRYISKLMPGFVFRSSMFFLGKETISVARNADVEWLQTAPPRRVLGGVAKKHIVLYGTPRKIAGVDFRLKLTKNGSSLDCTLLANGCTALYVIRVVGEAEYSDYAFVGLAACDGESGAKADSVHQTFAISVSTVAKVKLNSILATSD